MKSARGPKRALLTRRQLAGRLNVHMWTISTKWEPAGMPIAERGVGGRPSLYDETAVRAWLQEREEAAKSGKLRDVQQARAKKEIAQANLTRQTYRIRAGGLHSREDCERAKIAENIAIRSHLLSAARTLADQVFRAATVDGLLGVERVLNEWARVVLRELADGRHAQDDGAAGAPTPA